MNEIKIVSAAELEASYAGPHGAGEYPAYTRADWRECVAACNTEAGYWEWVHIMLSEEASAESDMGESGEQTSVPGLAAPADKLISNTEARVVKLLSDQLGWSEKDVTRDKHLVDDLGADSLDLIEAVMAVEEEFEFEISDEEAEKILTVGQVMDYVARRRGEM